MAAKKTKPASRASSAVKKGVRAAKGAVTSARGRAAQATSKARAKAAGVANAAKAAKAAKAANATKSSAGRAQPDGALARLKVGVGNFFAKVTGRARPPDEPAGVEDAIADPPYDVSGAFKISEQLARSQRGGEEDDRRLFSDPSLVIGHQASPRPTTIVDDPEESGTLSLFDEPAPARGPKRRLDQIAALGRRRAAKPGAVPVGARAPLFDPPDDD